MTSHIFSRHWRMTSKVRKRTSRNTKKWKFNTNIFNTVGKLIFVVFVCRLIHEIKNPTNNELLEAVWHWYYMLFIYQTGYIMWHSLIRLDSVFLKKPMVKSVIYLLFSYQTGYIMWHSRHRIYIPLRCASGNIEPKPGMSHYTCIGCLMKENTVLNF
jgi:hypothetical protein